MKYKADDICIKENDGDNSWGTQMCLELDPATGEGYASAFGAPKIIDRHLYSTIPATDCRKKCFVDFSVDNMTQEQQLAKLAEYSNYPSWLQVSASKAKLNSPAGFSLKFRLAGGEAGHKSQYIGYLMDVPLKLVARLYWKLLPRLVIHSMYMVSTTRLMAIARPLPLKMKFGGSAVSNFGAKVSLPLISSVSTRVSSAIMQVQIIRKIIVGTPQHLHNG